jgi:hypothetical protein
MHATQIWQILAWGAVGGVACELLHWYQLARQPGGAARFSGGMLYWLTTVGMIALGAVIPLLYIESTASALLCFHLGASTPLVLQKLVSALPAAVQTQGNRPSLRAFFNW